MGSEILVGDFAEELLALLLLVAVQIVLAQLDKGPLHIVILQAYDQKILIFQGQRQHVEQFEIVGTSGLPEKP